MCAACAGAAGSWRLRHTFADRPWLRLCSCEDRSSIRRPFLCPHISGAVRRWCRRVPDSRRSRWEVHVSCGRCGTTRQNGDAPVTVAAQDIRSYTSACIKTTSRVRSYARLRAASLEPAATAAAPVHAHERRIRSPAPWFSVSASCACPVVRTHRPAQPDASLPYIPGGPVSGPRKTT